MGTIDPLIYHTDVYKPLVAGCGSKPGCEVEMCLG